jgi:hypothetical protein
VRIDFLTKRGSAMIRPLRAAAVASLAICCAASTAEAQNRPAKAQQVRSAAEQCAREHGAGYDPVSKQLVMYATERDAMVKLDADRACVSRRTGVPQRSILVHEKPMNTPG